MTTFDVAAEATEQPKELLSRCTRRRLLPQNPPPAPSASGSMHHRGHLMRARRWPSHLQRENLKRGEI